MSFLKQNYESCNIGFIGESILRQFLTKNNIHFMQVDVMFKYKNKWCLGEIKSQEKFLSPPFDGHGLPIWQLKARLNFEKDTGITSYLFIYDLNDKCIYTQSLKNLINGENFKTNGKKQRIIFPIQSFKKITL